MGAFFNNCSLELGEELDAGALLPMLRLDPPEELLAHRYGAIKPGLEYKRDRKAGDTVRPLEDQKYVLLFFDQSLEKLSDGVVAKWRDLDEIGHVVKIMPHPHEYRNIDEFGRSDHHDMIALSVVRRQLIPSENAGIEPPVSSVM